MLFLAGAMSAVGGFLQTA